MTRVAVLGTGLVGRLIAADLAGEAALEVTAADRDAGALAPLAARGIETRRVDLGSPEGVRDALAGADAAAVAVPGRIGASVLRAVIEAGVPAVDISFSPEEPASLHRMAVDRGVPVVADCGVAPGISNLLAGRTSASMDRVEDVEILVGGLPVRRVWPYEYRAVFSPSDVLEEYTRPCRLREHGVEIVRPALSGAELVEFPEVGTLEAFYTDGLRTLLRNLTAPTLREKTLRYPGHAERMRMLRETGFFDTDRVEVDGTAVRPRALAERLLSRAWSLPPGEEEFTLLRVSVTGERGGARRRVTWDLHDRTDREEGWTSMARTTAFPCAIVLRLIVAGRWTRPGVHPPEILGRDEELTEAILEGLAARGVRIRRSEATPD